MSAKGAHHLVGKAISVIIIAFTVGVVHTFIKPKLDDLVPANFKANWVTQSFFTGAFIVVALIVSTTALRALKVPGVGKVA